MKLTTYIQIALGVLISISAGYNVLKTKENNRLYKIISEQTAQIQTLTETNARLSKKETYQISLSPTINNKVTATFGSAKEIENKFYFQMKDISMELKSDSVKIIGK